MHGWPNPQTIEVAIRSAFYGSGLATKIMFRMGDQPLAYHGVCVRGIWSAKVGGLLVCF